MTRYERVQQILEVAVQGDDIGEHGKFWKGRTRDEFVTYGYDGLPIIDIGHGANSNLVKALRGQTPFDGSLYPRMPKGYPPVPADQIDFIERWIDEGCLEDDFVAGPVIADAPPIPGGTTERHLAYWREFDRWSMFEATPEVNGAIDLFFSVASQWMAFARNAAQEPVWEAGTVTALPALEFLSPRQATTVRDFYGDPADLPLLFESYENFGAGTFPPDPNRPEDSAHQMNGANMWFVWSSFGDACLRRGIDAGFWQRQMRAMLLGLLNDGVFRRRFRVLGFTADPAGQAAMRVHVTSLAAADLPAELRRRYREALA